MKIVAKALITNVDGKILVLTRSSSHPLYPHHLDFPGGEVNSDETGVMGVIREINEETGLVIKAEYINILFQKQIASHKVYETYSTTIDQSSPEIRLSWEHDQYTWMTETELLRLPLPEEVDDYYQMVISSLLDASS